MNSRPYKAYAITGTDPEYVDCREAVNSNPEKYTYVKSDYPCATDRELAEYTRLNQDSQISSCYKQLFEHKITHPSRHTKIKLPNGALMLKIPGYIDNPGRTTGYNVNKDCTITVTTINSSNGYILKIESMSRGQFVSRYKIVEPEPQPVPEPQENGVDFIDELFEGTTDENGLFGLSNKGLLLVGGAIGGTVLLVLVATKM